MRYKVFVLFLLALVSMQSFSQAKRNLLQRYSIQDISNSVATKDKWKPFPQTVAEWKAKLPDSTLHEIIARGEVALKKEFKSIPATVEIEFVRTGNRGNYEKLSFEKRNMLMALALAEAVEGKGRFADQLMNGIWSVCEETFWGVPAHLGAQKVGKGLPDAADPIVDLFAAETAATLSWVDYFAGASLDKVSKLIRPRIYYETNRRIFTPMLTAQYGWMGNGNPDAKLNNWAPWIMSNYINTTLLLEPDQSKRTAAIKRAMNCIDQYMNGLGDDGGCDEGPSYWFAAGGAVFDALNLLDDASGGKINIYNEPFIQKMTSYVYKTHIGERYFINAADAPPQLTPNGIMLYRLGKAINDEEMKRFGSWSYHYLANDNTPSTEQFSRSRSLYDLMAMKDLRSYPSDFADVKDVWFSDVQLMASRSANGFFVAAHGGHNAESHNHNDVGDFMVYYNSQPIIVDVGSGTYTATTFSKDRYTLWFNTSPYHNLPTINDKQQLAGAQYKATDVKYETTTDYSRLNMDIGNAYDSAAGVNSWKRSISLNKKGNVEIKDVYKLNGSVSKLAQTFMTVCPADISTAGKIVFQLPGGKNIYMDYEPSVWTATKEKIKYAIPEDEKFVHSWEGKDIWRILLINKTNALNNSSTYLIHE
ncbi:MAG: Heparinase family protein [Chitinophagaceae bacterium]|nr:Heparinase family protein [Chitinophagaceae bacterium]